MIWAPSSPLWLLNVLLQAVAGPHDVDGEQRGQIVDTLQRLRPALLLVTEEEARFDASLAAQFANAASDLGCQVRVLASLTGSAQKALTVLSEAVGIAAPKLLACRLSVEEGRSLLKAVDALIDQLGPSR